MKLILCTLLTALLSLCATDAQARKHVTIHKRPPHASTQPASIPVAFIPPLAVFYDLDRRLNCNDYLGLGGPGFDSPVNPNSTVMPPQCGK